MPIDNEKLKICVHCGLCLEACPTYHVLKNEADSPRGRIALMRGVSENRIQMSETVLQHLDGCLDCRACETACPAGVPYGELIEEARSEFYPLVLSSKFQNFLKRFLLKRVLPSRKWLWLFSTTLKFYQRSGLQFLLRASGLFNLFPLKWRQAEALLPKIQDSPDFPSGVSRQQSCKSRVALFRGCIASVLFPNVERATIEVLQKLGCEVNLPENQTCCGALLVHGGMKEDAAALVNQNIEAFSKKEYDFVAVTAAGCGSSLKEHAQQFPIKDISEIIMEIGLPEKLSPVRLRVAYQDACHLLHAQKIKDPPRMLLKAIPELELIEIPQSDICCGSAGIYNLTHPEMASTLLKEKIENILSVKPDVVAVGNPGCALQIGMGLREAGSSIQVVHPIELLAKSLPNNSGQS